MPDHLLIEWEVDGIKDYLCSKHWAAANRTGASAWQSSSSGRNIYANGMSTHH